MQTRIKKSVFAITFVLLLGLCNYILIKKTGYGIPCFFYLVTGLYCPGCGVSGLAVNLLELNIYEAFRANPVIFSFIPFFIYFFIVFMYNYIVKGKCKFTKKQNFVLMVMSVVLIIYGILRNISCFY